MKNKTKIVSIVLFLSAFIMVISFGGQKAEWKGKIEYEDGIKVIKNPRDPLYGEIEFDLEEDLSIGNEEDENYMFYNVGMPAVDSKGNILVFERGNYRIQKFDKDGKYLQSIGRQGQGPGEFERPSSLLYLDIEDNIYVEDSGKIHVFNKNGEFRNTIILAEFGRPISGYFGITSEGDIIAHTISRGKRRSDLPMDNETFFNIDLINSEGKVIKAIANFLREKSSPLRSGTRFTFPNNQHMTRLCLCQLNENLSVYGFGSDYRLYIINSTGNIVYRIEKDEPPHPLTKKDIDKVLDRFMENQKKRKRETVFSRRKVRRAMNFPKYKPFFSDILSDNKGRIYVKSFKSRFDEEKNNHYDLFCKDGYYIYKATIPILYPTIKNGCVYTTEYDQETGYAKVKRYKIKNWEQIKEGI